MNKLLDKWKATGLLEGIEDELRKEFVANNLEITAKWLVKNANNSERTFQKYEQFAGILLPLVGRISRKETFGIDLEVVLNEFLEYFKTLPNLIPEEFRKSRLLDEELCLCDFSYHIFNAIILKIERENDNEV